MFIGKKLYPNLLASQIGALVPHIHATKQQVLPLLSSGVKIAAFGMKSRGTSDDDIIIKLVKAL